MVDPLIIALIRAWEETIANLGPPFTQLLVGLIEPQSLGNNLTAPTLPTVFSRVVRELPSLDNPH